MINHPILPVCDKNSKILILGSFPSVKSREQMFFYGHPQNRFWKVVSAVFGCETPQTTAQKRVFLISNKIALWDVIASCDISGSSDSSIKNVVPNNIDIILKTADIKGIFVNGKTAFKFYNKYIRDSVKREAVVLPSTSPANAVMNVEKLIIEWSILKEYVTDTHRNSFR